MAGLGEVGRYVGSEVGTEEGVRGGEEVDVQADTKAKKTAASVRTTAIFKGCSRQVGAKGIPSSLTDTRGEGSRCWDLALLGGLAGDVCPPRRAFSPFQKLGMDLSVGGDDARLVKVCRPA